MLYVVDSDKSVAEAAFDLVPVVQRLGFVVLHEFDFGEDLRRKGIDMDEECRVFELGHPRLTERVLQAGPRLGLALPCRIAVFTENCNTRLGLLRPEGLLGALLGSLGGDPRLAAFLREVEEKLIQIVDETR